MKPAGKRGSEGARMWSKMDTGQRRSEVAWDVGREGARMWGKMAGDEFGGRRKEVHRIAEVWGRREIRRNGGGAMHQGYGHRLG